MNNENFNSLIGGPNMQLYMLELEEEFRQRQNQKNKQKQMHNLDTISTHDKLNLSSDWQSYAEQVGDICEFHVNALLRRHGNVSMPYGDGAPYDTLFESNKTKKVYKIQVKHGKLTNNKNGTRTVTFRTISSNGVHYTTNDVDYFAIYNINTNRSWLVKNHDKLGKRQRSINIDKVSSQALYGKANEFDLVVQTL